MNGFTIAELAARLDAGEAAPQDLVREAYQRLRDHGDPALTITVVDEADAVAAAARLPEAGPRSPLWGLPFMVKDNIDVAGLATTAGCPAYAYRPARSAHIVQLLQRAGAIPIAKTNLDQFATGLVGTRSPYGTPRNPRYPDRVPGGSSSGSAAAVAAGIVPFALGTDTAGSGRVPAALMGIAGAKPTRGWLSTAGVVPAVRSIDCPSVFAGSVTDAWAVLEACADFDPDDPYSRRPMAHEAPAVLRFGFGFGAEVPARVREAAAAMGEVVDVDIDAYLDAGRLLYDDAFVAERIAAVGAFIDDHPGDVHDVVRSVIAGGDRFSAADAARAHYRLAALRRRFEPVWKAADVLVLPTVAFHPSLADVAADPVGINLRLGQYTTGTNLCDLCAMTVPSSADVPGVSVLAPAWADATVARAAAGLAALVDPGCPDAGWVPPNRPGAGQVDLAVVGAHLAGQPLHGQIADAGGRLVATTTTAAEYRLYVLPGTDPPKPGLVRVGTGGAEIAVEVYRMSEQAFGHFVAGVPAPLCIGTLRLRGTSGASLVSGFLCEPAALEGAADITHYGGWRAYRASLGA